MLNKEEFTENLIAGIQANVDTLYESYLKTQDGELFPLSDAPLDTPEFTPAASTLADGEVDADCATLKADASNEQLGLALVQTAIRLGLIAL